ncbi:unnamed protein product [Victoria cruziana]
MEDVVWRGRNGGIAEGFRRGRKCPPVDIFSATAGDNRLATKMGTHRWQEEIQWRRMEHRILTLISSGEYPPHSL